MYTELKKGHQIYVVAPLIEENEESNTKAVDTMYENMKKAFGKRYTIDMLHGKQDGKGDFIFISSILLIPAAFRL